MGGVEAAGEEPVMTVTVERYKEESYHHHLNLQYWGIVAQPSCVLFRPWCPSLVAMGRGGSNHW